LEKYPRINLLVRIIYTSIIFVLVSVNLTVRSLSRKSFLRNRSGCIAFGTFDITKLTSEEISLTPFSTTAPIHMISPTRDQLRNTLQEYRNFQRNCFAKRIIEDILLSAGNHLGIYGILCFQLQRVLEEENKDKIVDFFYSLWNKKKDLFLQDSVRKSSFRKYYSNIINRQQPTYEK